MGDATLDNEKYMRRAVELSAEAGLRRRCGGVFGAVVVDKATGQVRGEIWKITCKIKSCRGGFSIGVSEKWLATCSAARLHCTHSVGAAFYSAPKTRSIPDCGGRL